MQVDLPQPVGPTWKTNSPRPIFMDARSSPTEPPSYTIVTSSISTTGTSRRGAPEPARAPVLSVRVPGIRGALIPEAAGAALRLQRFLHGNRSLAGGSRVSRGGYAGRVGRSPDGGRRGGPAPEAGGTRRRGPPRPGRPRGL